MNNFLFEDIKSTFKSNDGLGKIITGTAIVFIITNLLDAFLSMANLPPYATQYLGLPADIWEFALQPWSIITYMFLHAGFLHFIFNMLWLYMMGKMLTAYIGNKAFVGVYVVGGLAGGLLYLLVFNFFGAISPGNTAFRINSELVGASAGVLAIVVAVGTLLPNNQINLMFIGPVKLKYVALGAIFITTIIDFHNNTGGKVAHFGGILYGYFYVKFRLSGKDIGSWFTNLINYFTTATKQKSKLKVAYKKTSDDYEYNAIKVDEQKQIDRILDKIAKAGYESLTKQEKEFLFQFSNKK